MSKASKRRRAALAAEAPVNGNMLERISTLAASPATEIKAEGGYSYRGPSAGYGYGSGYGYSGGRWWDKDNGTWRDSQPQQPANKGGHTFIPISKKDETTFTCASTDVEGKCPIATTPDIYLPVELWDMFIGLADACETEWIVLLLGKFEKGADGKDRYTVTGHYFPPQTATGTSVDIPSSVTPAPGTIGALHSHVQMSAFFSSTDKAHSNWPFEVVLNAKGDYAAISRFRLKCGEWTKQECKVWLLGDRPEAPDSPGWDLLKRAFSKGARLAKGKVATEDDSPEPATVPTNKAEAATASPLQPLLPLPPTSDLASDLQSDLQCEVEIDMGGAVETECAVCEGVGLVDVADEDMERLGYGAGIPGVEVCDKCKGWGRLLDGLPISAEGPKDLPIA